MSQILNPLAFAYKNAAKTDVVATWTKYGWKPTTEEERQAAQERLHNREKQNGHAD